MAPLPEDEAFMRMALAEAAKGDFPFGAVIVRESEVLAKGRNLGKTNNDPTAHGEMVAIRNFVAERPAQEFAKTTRSVNDDFCGTERFEAEDLSDCFATSQYIPRGIGIGRRGGNSSWMG
jgi:pyrimidine deaminase RibD-like protein